MKKILLYVVGIIALVASAFLWVFVEDALKKESDARFLAQIENLYKTCAHVDMSMYENLELAYVDQENDIAYYRYLNDWRFLEQGDTVTTIEGDVCTVVSTDCYGFVIETPTQINQGMSGTALLDENGNQIGYKSKRLKTGNTRCVWSIP